MRPRITRGGNLSDPAPFNCSAQPNRAVEGAQVENVAVVLSGLAIANVEANRISAVSLGEKLRLEKQKVSGSKAP